MGNALPVHPRTRLRAVGVRKDGRPIWPVLGGADKYTADELKDMLAKGEAFPNENGDPSFPIGDEEDLKNAIKAVGRAGSEHDDVRKYIIGRAKALGLSDLVPDDWNADGSLKDAKSAHPKFSQRDDGRTYNDTCALVQAALYDKLFPAGADDHYVWICDMTDEWAVYQTDWSGDLEQVTYMIDADGVVTLGEPTKVRRVTTYQPDGAEKKSAGRPKRATRGGIDAREVRTVELRDVSIRMDAADETVARFSGYASTTGVGYDVHDWLGSYRETIKPGAFVKTLRESNGVPLLFNHDGMPIANYRADGTGTMRLSEDSHGLKVEADLDRRQSFTNDLCIALERGDLSKMSFSFQAVRDKETWNDDWTEREVGELRLYDASIVTYPANPTTAAGLRAALGKEGRARLLAVAGVLTEMREGKVISSANAELLQRALDALHTADDNHLAAVDEALDEAQAAISQVLGTSNPDDDDPDEPGDDSKGNGMGTPSAAGDNPAMPSDGAGPRSANPDVAKAQADLLRLRGTRGKQRIGV